MFTKKPYQSPPVIIPRVQAGIVRPSMTAFLGGDQGTPRIPFASICIFWICAHHTSPNKLDLLINQLDLPVALLTDFVADYLKMNLLESFNCRSSIPIPPPTCQYANMSICHYANMSTCQYAPFSLVALRPQRSSRKARSDMEKATEWYVLVSQRMCFLRLGRWVYRKITELWTKYAIKTVIY